MKHLITYINEHIETICEAAFGPHDWDKHNYKYLDGVINQIETNKYILLGDQTKNGIQKIEFTNEDSWKTLKDALKAIRSNPKATETYDPIDAFNKAFIAYDSKSPIRWNKIWKTPFSGGATQGANAEIVVCYKFNNPEVTKEELEGICTKYQIDPSWSDSIIKTVLLMNNSHSTNSTNKDSANWNNQSYVAMHVDGNGLDDLTDEMCDKLTKKSAIALTTLFKDKKEINGILHTNIDFSKLYSKSKDEWNKADIVLIKKDKNYLEEIQDKFNSEEPVYAGLEGFNKMLLDYIASGIIIPISLKSLKETTVTPALYTHNIPNASETMSIAYNPHVELPATKMKGEDEEDDKSGSIYLTLDTQDSQLTRPHNKKNNTYNVQFYKRPTSSDLSPTAKVELELLNSKGGSGLQQMCNALGIKTSEAYASHERVQQGVEDYFGWKLNTLPETVKSAKNWYMKPCFTCLIGLLDTFVEKEMPDIKAKSDALLPFINFAVGACEGTGAYYIIK